MSDGPHGPRAVVEVLARALVEHPDHVRVSESQGKAGLVVELSLPSSEMGRVLGRQGRTAAALRTLAATAGEKNSTPVTVDIRETRG